MRVLSIGNDPKMFEPGSAVQKRQIEYGRMFERLDIVNLSNRIMNHESRIKLSENIFIYSINSKNKLFALLGAFSVCKRIIHNSCHVIRDFVVSTQDPFEHGLIGVWLKMRYGVPLQIQLHTDFNNKYFLLSSPLNFIRFFIAHITLPYADSVRVVSRRVEDSVKELNRNLVILPINIGSPSIHQRQELNQKILTVARLEKEKGLVSAIKAFALVSEKFPEATFTIVGDGSQKHSLELLAKSLKIESKISFVGWQDDLGQFYSSHSIYISTSLFEGYGMSVIEAAKSRLALVLSDAGIARDIPALISKPKDVVGFAESLEKLLSDKNLIQEMGGEAKIATEKLLVSQEKYLENYKEAMETVFNSKSRNFIGALFQGNKILRFIVAGGTAAFSQILLLYVFTDIFGIWYLYSSILAFVVALVISFLLQKFWSFRDHGVETVHIQFFKYTLIAISGLVFNTASMYLWVDLVHLWYILAQILTGVIIAVFNFFMYRKFIFPPYADQ